MVKKKKKKPLKYVTLKFTNKLYSLFCFKFKYILLQKLKWTDNSVDPHC